MSPLIIPSIKRRPGPSRQRHSGFTLIEVMVTLLVLVIGLLGVIGMQSHAAAVEFESYQRGQALALARDMQSRVLSSRGALTGYLNAAVSSTDGSVYFGNGSGAATYVIEGGNCIAPTVGDVVSEAKYQACSWGRDLQGVAQKEGDNAVGAMVGARGCVMQVNPPNLNALADLYIVVVWQGIGVRAEPPADSPSGECASDVNFGSGLRRGLSVRVLVPDLKKSTP